MKEFLTREKYFSTIEKYSKEDVLYWKRNLERAKKRWSYLDIAVNIANKLNFENCLEAGTMGIKIYKDSDVIDFDKSSKWTAFAPTYLHDLKKFPWPIEDKKYDLFISLRVFQHLLPVQKECFQEAKRIAKNILLAVPVKKETNIPKKIISFDEIYDWNDGKKPDKLYEVPYDNTKIIFWSEKSLG